jgi:hypothetical protein
MSIITFAAFFMCFKIIMWQVYLNKCSFNLHAYLLHTLISSFIHSFIHQWLYGPFGPWPWARARVFSFVIFFTETVGLLGRMISPSQCHYLHTGQHKHRINAHTNIHALSGILTHDPSVRASEDSSCLRPPGHCYRYTYQYLNKILNEITLQSLNVGMFLFYRESCN